MSLRGDILAAFAARLATVTADNGYTTTVKKVYYDDVPMGLDLQEYELPADIFKGIYAIHPTAPTNGAFRAIHPRIVEVVPAGILGDLNMIETNRVYEVSFLVRYRTELFDL